MGSYAETEYPTHIGEHRHSRARKSLKAWLSKVGLPYQKPHSFRHGHAVYGIQQSKDLSDLKAISMNLMHENLQVTDGVYGIFSNVDVQMKIAGLENNSSGIKSNDEIISMLNKLVDEIKTR